MKRTCGGGESSEIIQFRLPYLHVTPTPPFPLNLSVLTFADRSSHREQPLPTRNFVPFSQLSFIPVRPI